MFTTFVFPAFQKGISKNKRRLSVTVQPDCTSLLSTTGHMCRGVKIKSTFHLPVRRHIPHIFWYLLCPVQWWPSQIKVQTGRAWLESGHRFKERLHVQHMREFPGSPRRSFFISNNFIDLERFHCKVVKEEDTKFLVCIYKIYINTLQSQIHVPWVQYAHFYSFFLLYVSSLTENRDFGAIKMPQDRHPKSQAVLWSITAPSAA